MTYTESTGNTLLKLPFDYDVEKEHEYTLSIGYTDGVNKLREARCVLFCVQDDVGELLESMFEEGLAICAVGSALPITIIPGKCIAEVHVIEVK